MPGRCWWARSRRGPRGTSPGWGWWSPRTGSKCCWTESTGRGSAGGALVGSAADYLISMMPELQTVARGWLLIDLTFNLCLCVVELWVVPSWVGRVVPIKWTATIKNITFKMLVWQTQSLGDKEHFPKIAFVCSPCVSTCLALNVCSFWPGWLELRNLTENVWMDGWKIDGWVVESMDGWVDGWMD